MGPLEVTAGITVALVVVVGGVWVVAVRRRDRRRRAEVERRDALVRAQVLERLAQVTAQWEGRADEELSGVSDVSHVRDSSGADRPRAPVGGGPGAAVRDPAAVTGLGHPVDEHPRHRRPGHGIRVRRHRRA